MSQPKNDSRSGPQPPSPAGSSRPSAATGGASSSSFVWLLVDATAICGLSLAVATWAFTSDRRWLVAGEVVAGLMCGGAAIVAILLILRRRKAEPLRAAVEDGRQRRSTRAAGGGTGRNSGNSSSANVPAEVVVAGETITDLKTLAKRTASICFQHSDGSGALRISAALELFENTKLPSLQALIAGGDLRIANGYQRLLDRIALTLGESAPAGLQELRASIPDVLRPNWERTADQLAGTQDLQGFRELLTDSCFEHADGRGWVATSGLPILLAGITAEQMTAVLSHARPKALASLARMSGNLQRSLGGTCPGLDVLRNALVDAGRARLPTSQQAEWIMPFITGICCERPDGGGRVDRDAATRLFERLVFTGFGERLAHVPMRELNEAALILARMGGGLDEPQPSGFRGLVKAVNDAVELGAIRNQRALVDAEDLRKVWQIIVDTCCESDDGSGFQSRRALHALFDGVETDRFEPLIAVAQPSDRLALSQLIHRLDLDRHGESSSPGVQRLKELLRQAVERDRATATVPLMDAVDADDPDDAEPERPEHVRMPRATGGAPMAADAAAADGTGMNWNRFKHANLQACGPEMAQQVVDFLDRFGGDEDGFRRMIRRLWKGLRREGQQLTVAWTGEAATAEWARKRFLAEAIARRADRRVVPKLVALLEGECDDLQFREIVQPAVAKALVDLRDRRAVEALRRVYRAPHISSATRRVIRAASRS